MPSSGQRSSYCFWSKSLEEQPEVSSGQMTPTTGQRPPRPGLAYSTKMAPSSEPAPARASADIPRPKLCWAPIEIYNISGRIKLLSNPSGTRQLALPSLPSADTALLGQAALGFLAQ